MNKLLLKNTSREEINLLVINQIDNIIKIKFMKFKFEVLIKYLFKELLNINILFAIRFKILNLIVALLQQIMILIMICTIVLIFMNQNC